ncbi:MAG: excinuclease ABC subunit UvrA, partial [Saprospiraceae bacterium]
MADNEHVKEYINVIGAKVHNLKEINVKIPRNQLVVVTGISGSGKSSLAFDTIYAEGQRRYMETFSAYARQFIGSMERPDVEEITGLSPVISIEQKTTGRNPRSTVGTVTEVYDFLRLLFARASNAYSYKTGKKMVKFTEEQIVEHIFENYSNKKTAILAPIVRGRKGHYRELFDQYRKQGYTKVRVDGEILDLVPKLQVDRYKVHDIEIVIDRLKVSEQRRERITNALRTSLKLGKGLIFVKDMEEGKISQYSKNLMCPDSGISYEEPSPNAFSFNSPYGACPSCKGLGKVQEIDMSLVIPDDTLSINKQGIVPLGEVRDNYSFKQLRVIAKEFGFTFFTPIKDISEEALNTIFYGGNKELQAKMKFDKGGDYTHHLAKEGLLNMLKRWHSNSSSDGIRRWIEDFMTETPCE